MPFVEKCNSLIPSPCQTGILFNFPTLREPEATVIFFYLNERGSISQQTDPHILKVSRVFPCCNQFHTLSIVHLSVSQELELFVYLFVLNETLPKPKIDLPLPILSFNWEFFQFGFRNSRYGVGISDLAEVISLFIAR